VQLVQQDHKEQLAVLALLVVQGLAAQQALRELVGRQVTGALSGRRKIKAPPRSTLNMQLL
jgi:hypothetical protein